MKTGSDVRALEIARDRATRQAASVPPRPTTAPHPLLVLQRKVGNQAVRTIIVTDNDAAVQRDPSPIRDDYTHLDVTSAGAEITDSGEFAGLSVDEFNEAKLRLREQGKAFTVAAARIEMLRPKVIQAWDRLQTEKGHLGAGAQALGVFTAPEWFFKKPGIPFIAADKDRIIEAFRSLSEQYTELVLVPGTIVWSDGDGKSLRIRNTAFVVLNGHLVKTTDKVGDFGDTDSYFYRKADPSTHELPPKSEITAAWNRGRTPADNKSVPDDPSAFRVGNVTFSVEICGDFGRAKQDQALGRAPASGIDVQILVSHGSTLAGGMVITKPGGVALHNDATSGGVRARREAKVSALPGGIAPAPTTQSIVQGDAAIDDLHLPPVPLPANTPAARRARAAVYLDRMKTIVHALRTSWDQLAGTVKGDVTARKDEYRQAVEAGGADSDGARNARGRLMQAEIMKGAASKAKSWLPGLDKRAQALPQGGTLTSATAPKAVAKAISIASDASRRYDKLANEARDFQVGAELAVTARALQELHEEGLAG